MFTRKRRQAQVAVELFAFGCMPMLLRTKGQPKGYVRGKKGTTLGPCFRCGVLSLAVGSVGSVAAQAGPRMRTINVEHLEDVKDSMWRGAKTSNQVLRELFPDIMSMFVLEQKKKEVSAEEAAAQNAKPKIISFLIPERSKKLDVQIQQVGI
jgi:hypothetical protein